jgi:hypothetical protein
MQVHNTQIITGKLSSGEIDLGLVEGPLTRANLIFKPPAGGRTRFLSFRRQNPLAYKTRVDVAEVLAGNLIFARKRGSGTRKEFEDRLLSLG